MVNPCPDISIRRTNKTDDDRCLCHSSHLDIVVDDSHKPIEAIEFVQLSEEQEDIEWITGA
jgi:hypothetical protein